VKTGVTIRGIGELQDVPIESLSTDELWGYVRSASRNELMSVVVGLVAAVKQSHLLRDGRGEPVRTGRVDAPAPLEPHEGVFELPHHLPPNAE
jgi:hypothetical protein